MKMFLLVCSIKFLSNMKKIFKKTPDPNKQETKATPERTPDGYKEKPYKEATKKERKEKDKTPIHPTEPNQLTFQSYPTANPDTSP